MTDTIVPSCGCVFCDMGLEPTLIYPNSVGKYHGPNDEIGYPVLCTRSDGVLLEDDEPSPQDLLKVRVESKAPKCGNCDHWRRGRDNARSQGFCMQIGNETLDLAVCSLWVPVA